jgi:hypothetical protein
MPVLGADRKPLRILDIRDAMKVLFEQEELQEHMLPTTSPASVIGSRRHTWAARKRALR